MMRQIHESNHSHKSDRKGLTQNRLQKFHLNCELRQLIVSNRQDQSGKTQAFA